MQKEQVNQLVEGAFLLYLNNPEKKKHANYTEVENGHRAYQAWYSAHQNSFNLNELIDYLKRTKPNYTDSTIKFLGLHQMFEGNSTFKHEILNPLINTLEIESNFQRLDQHRSSTIINFTTQINLELKIPSYASLQAKTEMLSEKIDALESEKLTINQQLAICNQTIQQSDSETLLKKLSELKKQLEQCETTLKAENIALKASVTELEKQNIVLLQRLANSEKKPSNVDVQAYNPQLPSRVRSHF